MTSPTPPGWYPDPGGTAPFRWWDGQTWTATTSAGAPPATPVTTAGAAAPAIPPQPQPYGFQPVAPPTTYSRPTPTGWEANKYAVYTFGIVAIYVLLAVVLHFGILGIVPVAMAVRSKQANEAWAPFAIGTAVVAVVIGVATIFGH